MSYGSVSTPSTRSSASKLAEFFLFENLLNPAQARRLLFIREIKKHPFLA